LSFGIPDGSNSYRIKKPVQISSPPNGSAKVHATLDAGFTQSSFNGFKDGKATGQKNFLQLNTKLHNCWICEAWVECFFEIDLIELYKIRGEDLELSDNLEVIHNVYIHFDFDDYQPDKMND